ncbi:MAG: urease accessory protein UreD [Nitrospiraceae bacterium]
MSRKRKSPQDVLTELVGRAGQLRLDYGTRGCQTVITRSHCTSPWHLLPPIYLDETGAAYTLLLNPSGGLVGGDHLSIDLRLDAGAHVLISAPSANRVYRSRGEVSVQEVEIALGAGAVLEWLPEHTIPFGGSRYRQTVHVTLAPGATILLWDAVASGRIARAERWAFTSLENEIRITTASGNSILERYVLDPATDLGRIGLAEEWDYVASLYVVNDTVSSETWSRLETKLGHILDEHPEQLLAGVSTPAVPGVGVKLLTRTAPDLTRVLDAMWAAARAELWNLPPVAWRKY